jgi:carbon storage regulator
MALVLTRSVGERILIGDDIVIEVRAIIDGRQVRIAIDAPRQVAIHRAEIYDAVSAANAASSGSEESLLSDQHLEVPQDAPDSPTTHELERR